MTPRRLPVLALLGLFAALIAAGCGEKIAIPEPEGLYSVAPYRLDASFDDDDPRQLTTVQGILFVLNRNSLAKRDQSYAEIAVIEGLADPTALCSDESGELIFVWDQGLGRVNWYLAQDLSVPDGETGQAELPAVQSCVGMATSPAGVEQVPGAVTFLYLADPDSGVVHRYAYDPAFGLVAHGILCRSDGDATRFVHLPGGLARDLEDSLLVCDRDTLRNWVIRFDAEPDQSDADPDGVDPLRGRAALFGTASCNPPAAADYVLGDAAGCDEAGWEGGPSDALGEFTDPAAVAVDGSGRIFVSDTGNDRFQIFSSDGFYEMAYGSEEETPAPGSLAVVDVRSDENPSGYNRGAFIFAVVDGQVRRYISGEHYLELYGGLPPPED